MFERYTENARRVIFFGRYEASQFGSPHIESEHLLLGILREDKSLTNRFLRTHAVVESIRKQIEAQTTSREKTSTSVDLPLSNESKRVLAYAAEEAERLGNKHIGTEHLLLGLLREEKCMASAILKERGLEVSAIRESLTGNPHINKVRNAPAAAVSSEGVAHSEFSHDLIQAAAEGVLEQVVGRDEEIDALIEILSASRKNNPILIGERGVGKTAIVEGLARHIADGAAPAWIAEKRVLVLNLQFINGGTQDGEKVEESVPFFARTMRRHKIGERLNNVVKSLADLPEAILFIDDLHDLYAATAKFGPSNDFDILKPALLAGKIRCIGACTPAEYWTLTQASPWLADCFRAVHVRAIGEENTLRVLELRKDRYEQLHGVSYSQAALESAARNSGRYLPECPLPGKALELMDAAGAHVKLRQGLPPAEIAETMKRIKFITHRLEASVANHEFEKARFYSDEERKEREKLRALKERYKLDDSSTSVVGPEDIEEVIDRWSAYPYHP